MNIKKFFFKLFYLNRSLTGEGNLKTLKEIKKISKNLKIKSFKSGKKVFDWKIPYEWILKSAWIKNENGNKIIDFKDNNLHVVGYSKKVSKILNFKKLKENIFYLKNQPNAIPYVTSYYKKNWGFCMTYNEFKKLKKKENFEVFIDSSFKKSKLIYGENILKGRKKNEILLSTYICHPSMANNELSGPIVASLISNWISKFKKRQFTYRIVFLPETIGSIAYIKHNLNYLKNNVIAGYVLTCLGDERAYSLLPTKYGKTLSDRVASKIFKTKKIKFKTYSWLDRGSDERQYGSPNVDLPIASIMRTKYGKYPEYHTSDDKFGKVVTIRGINQSFEIMKSIVNYFENSIFPLSKNTCEPFLTKKNLIKTYSTKIKNKKTENILNFLTYSDGKNEFEEICKLIKLNKIEGKKILKLLLKEKLITI